MNLFNYAHTVNFCICRENHFLRISTLFCFAVNCSNTIRKTKPIRVATIIVLNRNNDTICKITFSCMHQIAKIITECKTGLEYNYVGCSLARFTIKFHNSTTQSKKMGRMRIFRLYLTFFIRAVPGQWSELCDL